MGTNPAWAEELDEYFDLVEQVAADPDAPAPARYYELGRKYATDGAAVGYRHGAPVFVSVGPAFLSAIHGASKGIQHAR